MTARPEVHDEISRRLGAAEQRYTTSRRQLVDALVGAGRPLTPGELAATSPGLAQSSAYRNLTVLTDAGVLRRVVGDDEFTRFELSEAVSGHHHHHLVCRHCGAVTDISLDPQLETAMDRAAESLAAQQGFVVEDHRFDLLGRCRRCAD